MGNCDDTDISRPLKDGPGNAEFLVTDDENSPRRIGRIVRVCSAGLQDDDRYISHCRAVGIDSSRILISRDQGGGGVEISPAYNGHAAGTHRRPHRPRMGRIGTLPAENHTGNPKGGGAPDDTAHIVGRTDMGSVYNDRHGKNGRFPIIPFFRTEGIVPSSQQRRVVKRNTPGDGEVFKQNHRIPAEFPVGHKVCLKSLCGTVFEPSFEERSERRRSLMNIR